MAIYNKRKEKVGWGQTLEQIPTVDLSPFMSDHGNIGRQVEVENNIFHACAHLGVFQIENHGISLDRCEKLMKLSKEFFRYQEHEKILFTASDRFKDASRNCYGKMQNAHNHYEYVLMRSPETKSNGVPRTPEDYRETFKAVYEHFLKTAQILEKIINKCLGLPENVLKNYNNDRSEDCLLAMKYHPSTYHPSTKNENIGIFEHQDQNMFSIVLEDEVSGLQVLINNKWIPIKPAKDKLVVVIGDVIQALSNKIFINVTHRAFRHNGISRHAIVFSYGVGKDKKIAPLRQLTRDIKVRPKYKGFLYHDYLEMKEKNEMINLKHYEIESCCVL